MKSRFSEEQVIGLLKQHESGVKTADLCREHGISATTTLAASRREYNCESPYSSLD